MGIDLQFVAYQGEPLTEDELARLLRNEVPGQWLYRHARSPLAASPDLHAVALYERLGHGSAHLNVQVPSAAEVPPDASLSDIVKLAWKATRTAIQQMPAPAPAADDSEDEAPQTASLALAQALSHQGRRACWLLRGDHSCMGGYALFAGGQRIEQATDGSEYAEGNEYLDVPARKWASATGAAVDPSDFFWLAFPDEEAPVVRHSARPGETEAFDPHRFGIAI